MPFLNFLIDLALQTDGKYCITVQSSPVGEATVTVDSPFSADDIQNALATFSRRRQGLTRVEETQAARQFGERLFNFLIRRNEDINAAYFASLDRAGANGLRLSLSLGKAGPLAELPWELMRDPNRDFLALSTLTPVVRYTRQLNIRPPVPVTLPLRVLVLISAPIDLPTLNVEGEWQRLQAATTELQKHGVIALERLEAATLIALQRRLRAEDYHVFHFIGHSDYDAKNQQGVLILESETDRRAHLITGDALAREIGGESTVRLVVLNSCQSSRRADHDPFSGLASSLVQLGIPAVVAMQFPITDGAASVFAEEFYRSIAESLPIDGAVGEARRAIANRIQTTEWATPVLYLRSDSGVLFRSAATPAEAVEKAPAPRRWIPVIVAVVILLALVIGGAVLFGGRGTPQPPITPTAAGKANLEVAGVRSSPARPAPGEAFRLLIAIRNSGIVDSGPFNWTWDASPTLLNALGGRIDNIAPGATQNISFPYSYGWWGSYSSQIIVDADSEIAETDERDNRKFPVIQLDDTRPFVVDFTLLPDNQIVTPPHALTATEFVPWNLAFAAVSSGGESCIGTPFQIIGLTEGNALTAGEDATAACAQSPLAVILRKPVGNVAVQLSSASAAQATLIYFSDESGTNELYRSAPVAVRAGSESVLGANDGVQRRVRRVEISTGGQPVMLTRLSLFQLGE